MADFELICSNAMTYNQKRSRVHKSALSMLRAGKKQLQAAELEGRKVGQRTNTKGCFRWALVDLYLHAGMDMLMTSCVYVQAIALLHPEGPTAAAADEAREAAEAELAAAAAARHPSKVAKLALRQGSVMSEAPSGTPKTGAGMTPRMGSSGFLGAQHGVAAETPSCTDADDFQVGVHLILNQLLYWHAPRIKK